MSRLLYSKEISEKENYELIVCGGGMSGISCAIAAAERGLKTALIEKNGCLGGNGTAGGVNHLLGGRARINDNLKCLHNVSGIFDRLTDALIKDGYAIDPDNIDRYKNPHGWCLNHLSEGVPFDGEMMKLYLERMCAESGVKIYYFTDIIDVTAENKKIRNVIVHNKSGLFALKSKYFADTTGDADIAYLSGCSVEMGKDNDGKTAPATLEFFVSGVDTKKVSDYIYSTGERRFRKIISQLREKGEWKFPYDIFISVKMIDDDVYMINTSRLVGVDGTNGDSITEAIKLGREEMIELVRIMKSFIPGFENAKLHHSAEVIGIRETRRIIGKYVLKTNDLINGIDTSSSIACSSYGWDLPTPQKPSEQPMHGVKRHSRFTNVPYECLLPDTIENLIVAGRCISCEREALGPIREMAPCFAMGEASGIATVIANKNGCGYESVDIKQLQTEIENANGVFCVDDSNDEIKVNGKKLLL